MGGPMENKPHSHLGWNVIWVLAWILGPIHWIIQRHPELTVGDVRAWSMALKGYGIAFIIVLGFLQTGLYLYRPVICLKLWRYIWRRCRAGSGKNG